MNFPIPVLAVIGHKNSGKTTVIEKLVRFLSQRRIKVATAKHVSDLRVSIDREGKDSWRHSNAGANPVAILSNSELTIKLRDVEEKTFPLRMCQLSRDNESNVLILEGFSSNIIAEKKIGKIICIKNLTEYKEYNEKAEGPILGYFSFESIYENEINLTDNMEVIVENAANFIVKEKKIHEIQRELAGLDCGRCGREDCRHLAKDIYNGKAESGDCVPKRLAGKLETKIILGKKEVQVQPFVSEIIRRTVLGMVSTLKGVKIEGEEKVHIVITKRKRFQ